MIVGDFLFPYTAETPPGVKPTTRLNKHELVNILWTNGGMHHFGESRRHIFLDRAEPVELSSHDREAPATISIERFHFTLEFTSLGREKWAYVLCNGVVVVPPFEFIGWEYLPAHPW